jgi:ATPase subunit of ABC transporter with duplicated ATPase domains
MISAANITVQFGEKPLFEDVSVKFGNGHRYGLIGANGSGKTTFLKILGGELEPTHGNVAVTPGARVGKLRQDQFAFEESKVIHTVIMGHERLWQVYQEREQLYSLATSSPRSTATRPRRPRASSYWPWEFRSRCTTAR